ncbi:P-loop NTPase fold protein [Rhizobium leguminosarum]|uniref:P-loop NTPase fold protein n=1 Tax=Rhizobium leguminosarum TaxID=384 RepID=UPI0014948BDC|nr:P-loop NTPase fold protein [Rhizobium leguminosarum]
MVSIKNTFNSKELEGGESGSSAQSATPAMETSTAIGRGPEETFKLPDDDPRAWILQYAPDDRVARWTREATSGSILAWKSGKALPKAMRAGDPVVYWRAIDPDNHKDRGGLVGVGRVISIDTEDQDGILRFPTQVTVFNEDTPLSPDEVIREAGITRRNWRGAVLVLRPEETKRLDAFLRSRGMHGLIEDVPRQPRFVETHDTDYVSDRPETDRDLLNRVPLAFALAYNINKIWTVQTIAKEPRGWGRRLLDWLHFERLNRQTREPDEAAFILHLDAPWGGGKTTFANFVARILNPAAHGYDMGEKKKLKGTLLGELPLNDPSYWNREFSERRWFVVDFNAWQNEHVSPPWWNFYETIRRQCLRAILFEPGRFGGIWRGRILRRVFSWYRFQITEVIWRVGTPEMRNTLLLLLAGGLLLYWVTYSDWFITLMKPPKEGTQATDFSPMLKGMFSLAGIAVTGGAGLALVNAFRSGLTTIIDSAGKSANASSLGEADPIQKFRRHFSWFVSQLDEPVLVIVDDLDRCSPKYVVELVRGLLTIFRSPRVVFVLLGDKDWIETAFAKVHKEMADVHTDAQITFGGRFAEKAIQLSFLLPESDQDAREAYLTAILATGQDAVPEDLKETVEALQKVEARARADLAKTDRAEDQEAAAQKTESLIREVSAQTASEHRDVFEKAATRILNRERMLRAATARSTETVVRQHGLKPLKHFLPANPRRIKRIINMVSAYQASAQSTQGVKQGSDKWKQLVIWVVMMSEYPQIWKMLVTDPDRSAQLLDLIKASKKGEAIVPLGLPEDASDTDKVRHIALTALLATPGLTPLLRGDPFTGDEDTHSPACIDTDASEWLRRLTPID